MAHTIEVTNILPGTHRSQFHVYLLSDGASGELTDEVLIDPVADLGLSSDARPVIEMITYNFSSFDGRVEFDSGLVDDYMIWALPQGSGNHIDFNMWGGLKDKSGLDGTGKIQLSTTGFGVAGAEGSMLIMVRNS